MKFVFVLTLALSAFASSGDRSPDFQDCLQRCDVESCQDRVFSPPLSLRITRWTCLDDCKYVCMHRITDRDVFENVPIEQYYGKWPFYRIAGMQEPASVAFSLLNLWFHVKGFGKFQKRIPNDNPMKGFYLVWSLISINAWVWSAVFHARDVPVTEKLDYFSAASTILYGLYYSVIRLFHLYPPPQNRVTPTTLSPTATHPMRRAWSITCILVYIAHISYLTLLPRFDYTYNIVFNLVLGLTHNALWLIYSLPASMSLIQRFPSRPKSYRPSFVGQAALLVALTMAATTLELFDFPPWGRTIDAHSLWHLSTAPLVALFYDFLIEDACDEGWREEKA